jgi:hypothetical protein
MDEKQPFQPINENWKTSGKFLEKTSINFLFFFARKILFKFFSGNGGKFEFFENRQFSMEIRGIGQLPAPSKQSSNI